MAVLDALTAALGQLGTDVTKAASDVSTELAALQAQIADLQAGTITQDQIDALTAQANQVDSAVQALDASAAPPAAPSA